MTHYKSMTDPSYLGSWSLMNDDAITYREIALTITGTSEEKVFNKGEIGGVLTLHLKDSLPMILNVVNRNTVVAITGSVMVENWVGKTITVYVEKVRLGRETVPALRIRPKLVSVKAKEVLNSEHPKWEEAVKAITEGNVSIDQIKKRFTLTPESEIALHGNI